MATGATVGVVVFPGSNCDRDVRWALEGCLDLPTRFLWHEERDLSGLDAVVIPGGFSYGDYLRCGAIAGRANIMDAVRAHAARGGLVLGVCNGFQILCESGLLPGVLRPNASLQFICRQADLEVADPGTPWTGGRLAGEVLSVPFKHHDGAWFGDPGESRVVLRYKGENPNGTTDRIAGIANAGGDVAWSLWVTKFAPPERVADYMSVHTFFTGVRGVAAPLIAFHLVGSMGMVNLAWLCAALIGVSVVMLGTEVPLGRKAKPATPPTEEVSE